MGRKVLLLVGFLASWIALQAQVLSSVSPNPLAPGYSGTFTVTGTGTNFSQSTGGINLRLTHVGSGQIYNFGNAPGGPDWSPGYNGMPNTTASGTITLPGNAPVGAYDVTLFGWHGFYGFQNLTITGNSLLTVAVPPNVGYISGKVVLEVDSNCVQTVGENGLPNRLIYANPGGYLTATDAYGNYSLPLPLGTYTISTVTTGASMVCPVSPYTHTVTLNTSGQTIGGKDFYMKSNHQLDIATSMVVGPHRPGFSNNYWAAQVTNNSSTTALNVVLKVAKQSNLNFLTFTIPPSSVAGDTAYFNVGSLAPNYTYTVTGMSYVPINTLGQSFNYTAIATTSNVDTSPFNNSFTAQSFIQGSYDPNDKQVWTATGANADGFIEPTDSLLRYLIRFQNTGTDTAFNIIVRDTFDADLNMSTLNVTGASHPYQLQIPDSTGRRVAFNFQNVLLVDSFTNEAASHGWIQFTVRKKTGLANGTIISNKASIYFDFNSPVVTNTVNSKICPSLDSVFTNTSSELTATFHGPTGGNATGWAWNYGDGQTGTGANPAHTYANPGTYNVCLTVSNACGRSRQFCQSVTVTCAPMNAAFTSNQTAPLTLHFTQGSTGGVTGYQWQFGDGGVSTSASPNHVYASGGTYTVCLIITNTCGDHDTTCVSVTPTCGAINAAFSSTSSGSTANFSSQSVGQSLSLHWDFGDGSFSPAPAPNHTYTLPGSYTVCLTVTDACGIQDSTCSTVTVGCAAAVAGFNSTAAANTLYFSNTSTGSGLSYAWDFGDGNTSTAASPQNSYALPGTYNVCLVVTNACGEQDSICHTVTASCAALHAGFTASSNALVTTFTNQSSGSGLGHAWDFGDGNTSTLHSPTHTYAAAGTYNVCLIESDACQGHDTVCLPIVVTLVGVSPAQTTTLQVLPNPTTGQALLLLDCIQLDEAHFAITDITGKVVQQWQEPSLSGQYQRQLDLSDLASGMYFLQLRAQGVSKTLRVMVH